MRRLRAVDGFARCLTDAIAALSLAVAGALFLYPRIILEEPRRRDTLAKTNATYRTPSAASHRRARSPVDAHQSCFGPRPL